MIKCYNLKILVEYLNFKIENNFQEEISVQVGSQGKRCAEELDPTGRGDEAGQIQIQAQNKYKHK